MKALQEANMGTTGWNLVALADFTVTSVLAYSTENVRIAEAIKA
jgi:hypothetical protein